MSLNAPAEIRMINSIAGHFGYLHAEQAAAAVADHIKRFWDPRMKQRLLLACGLRHKGSRTGFGRRGGVAAVIGCLTND